MDSYGPEFFLKPRSLGGVGASYGVIHTKLGQRFGDTHSVLFRHRMLWYSPWIYSADSAGSHTARLEGAKRMFNRDSFPLPLLFEVIRTDKVSPSSSPWNWLIFTNSDPIFGPSYHSNRLVGSFSPTQIPMAQASSSRADGCTVYRQQSAASEACHESQ